jgi:hypothetical protein
MDLSSLPLELIRHIQSFVFIVSWRANFHFLKLYQFFRSQRFHTLPPSVTSTITEYNDRYRYVNLIGMYEYAYKWNPCAVEEMKMLYVQRYTAPLYNYLTTYRLHHIRNAWSSTASFHLFGIEVNGMIYPYMYQYLLKDQAKRAGCVPIHGWQGCLSIDEVKQFCTLDRLPSLEYSRD